jgi:retron-type reverse transcriptase
MKNKGATTMGIDGMSKRDFSEVSTDEFGREKVKLSMPKVYEHVEWLHDKFQAYKPMPVKRVYIPKTSMGKEPYDPLNPHKRGLGIPTIDDRIYQKILLYLFEPM